jgi:hypothetical protein
LLEFVTFELVFIPLNRGRHPDLSRPIEPHLTTNLIQDLNHHLTMAQLLFEQQTFYLALNRALVVFV